MRKLDEYFTGILEKCGLPLEWRYIGGYPDFSKELFIKARHHDEIIDTGFTYDLEIKPFENNALNDFKDYKSSTEEIVNRLSDVEFYLTVRDITINTYGNSISKRDNLVIYGYLSAIFDKNLFKLIHEKLTEYSELPNVGGFFDGKKVKSVQTITYLERELLDIIKTNDKYPIQIDGFDHRSIKTDLIHKNTTDNKKVVRAIRSNDPISISITYVVI